MVEREICAGFWHKEMKAYVYLRKYEKHIRTIYQSLILLGKIVKGRTNIYLHFPCKMFLSFEALGKINNRTQKHAIYYLLEDDHDSLVLTELMELILARTSFREKRFKVIFQLTTINLLQIFREN